MAQATTHRAQNLRRLAQAATRIRRHSLRMTTTAGSGHATTCLSEADLLAALFGHVLRYDVDRPSHPDNDRFILSKGHGVPALYAALAEAGAFPPARLATLRRIDSDLEGHPTPRLPWIDVATGSLGQGLSVGVGMAIAARLARRAYRTYVVMGDAETAEGAVWEAAALASHRGLDNLVGIVDVNRLGQSGPTMYGHDLDQLARRFRAFGWHAMTIDGHDLAAIVDAFEAAARVRRQPVAILARTRKGKGVAEVEDREGWHGKPLPAERLDDALAALGGDDAARVYLTPRPPAAAPDGAIDPKRLAPTEAVEPPSYDADDQVATRDAYGAALAKLGAADPRIVVLDGDVKDSTRAGAFFEAYPDRFIESFVAEQNMVGMAMGLQARGFVPFVSTFACFLTRAFDQIRMAGISRANLKLAGSHAGVSIGEDGPSQMGLEDLAMMRAVAGATVLYPADAVATERLVALAAAHTGIVYLRTTRPKTPILYPNDEEFTIGGCKVLRAGDDDRLTIVAAGITVHEALRAHATLAERGIAVRVIDLYSIEPLDRDALLAAARETEHRLLVVEDHYPAGGIGEAVSAAVAAEGVAVHALAVRTLPRSGPGDALLARHGIDADAIVESVRALVPRARHRVAAKR